MSQPLAPVAPTLVRAERLLNERAISRPTQYRVPRTALLAALIWAGALAFLGSYPVADDAKEYDVIAQNLIAGHGFSLSVTPPFTPTVYREPMYPLLLSGVFLMAGHRYVAVQVVQLMLLLLLVCLVHRIAFQVWGASVARTAALWTALAPPLANYPSYLLSETLFTFLLVALIWALLETVDGQRMRWFIIAGILWAAAALCRAVALPLIVPILLLWLLVHRRSGVPARQRLIRYAACCVAGFILIGPWMIRNQRLVHKGVITVRGGRALWERAQRLDYTGVQFIQSAVFSCSEFAGKRLFPSAVNRPRDFLLRESALANAQLQAWQQQGLSEVEIDQRFLEEGWRRIRRHPLAYIAQSGLEWLRLMSWSYLPLLNEQATERAVVQRPHGRAMLAMARGLLRLLVIPVVVLAILGAYRARTSWRRWAFIALPIVVLSVVHGLLVGYGRYGVPLIPCYVIFAAAGWHALHQRESEHALARA